MLEAQAPKAFQIPKRYRHGQAKVFEEGDHHHDSAANHTEAAIGNTGELCNRRTSRIDSRNHGDNQKDDPCKGASQKRPHLGPAGPP